MFRGLVWRVLCNIIYNLRYFLFNRLDREIVVMRVPTDELRFQPAAPEDTARSVGDCVLIDINDVSQASIGEETCTEFADCGLPQSTHPDLS